ncbi:MAG: hypothetical protein JW809_06170 [Pirellulales bacterium]|nr:hypothetical protein [Pirellulales bacterium]
MRLTLRTLLAYMDGILEPQDAEEIGKKIDASPVAADLLRRARDVTRRLRLKAPEVDERGSGLDPNTVAEYLDHMLPDDRVPDLERVCLESDMHLAEVAACHQILTLVLGEPAEIDPASREHMYQLPQVAAEEEAMGAVEEEPATESRTPPPLVVARRPKPVVPDYLREPSRRSRWVIQVVVAILLVGCLAVIGLEYGGQLERWGIGLRPRQTEEPADPEASVPPAAPLPPPEIAPLAVPTVPTEPAALPGAAASSPDVPPAVLPEPAAADQAPGLLPIDPGASPPGAALPAEPGTLQPDANPLRSEPALPGPIQAVPEASPIPDSVAPVAPPEGLAPPGAAPAEVPAEAAERIGRYVSTDDVLLQSSDAAKEWALVPAQGALTPESTLLALPTYRPLIAMANGMTVHLIGGTQIRLLPTNDRETPGVAVEFGRMIVRTAGRPEARLVVEVAGRRGLVTLVDPEGTLAVEVTRPLIRGANPETEPAEPVAELYAVAGNLLWEDPSGGAPRALSAPAHWTLGAPAPDGQGSAAALPDWVASDTVNTLYRRTSADVARLLRADRPVILSFQEMTTDRKREVVWLAEECLGYLGDFDRMVKVLNDREKKLDWTDYIARLRQSLTRGSLTAQNVRVAMERVYGDPGAALWRMLQGYTNEQLAAGADAELVRYLDDDTLAFRVLAIANLKEITGASLFYRPEDPAVRRQQPVRAWQQRRTAGEIRWPAAAGETPKTEPTPLAREAGPAGPPPRPPGESRPPE